MGQSAADQLRHVIVPHLVHLVGDVKTQRVSVDLVLAYLQRQQLHIDEQMLRSMFAEADFKHEGSLALGPLTGAIQGRFPKRKYGQKDWLALVSVILRRPVNELQDLLAPLPSKSVRFATAKSMDSSLSAPATQATVGLKGLSASKRNPAFVRKAPSGEWHTLIKATSSMQQASTGQRMTMSDSRLNSDTVSSQQNTPTTARLHMPDHATAVGQASAAHSSVAPAAANDPMMMEEILTPDNLSATAMSIDTPSYARPLAMGQLGLPAGSAAGSFGVSQSLCEAMSIDGQHQMPFWSTAASATSGPRSDQYHNQAMPMLMMTTSGLKSLNETQAEQQINCDLRQGVSSFAGQQQFQTFVAVLSLRHMEHVKGLFAIVKYVILRLQLAQEDEGTVRVMKHNETHAMQTATTKL